MYTLEELIPLINKWATDKNIHTIDCVNNQKLKLIEESGELAGSILKNNIEIQKDSIGDIFVVLVILNLQYKVKPKLDFESFSFDRVNHIYNLLSHLTYIGEFVHDEIAWLNELSVRIGLDLTECANLAWNEIKDRTGNMVNGSFIKD